MAVARHAVASKRRPSRARTARPRAVALDGLHRCIRRSPRRTAHRAPFPLAETIAEAKAPMPAPSLRDDLRLFATTFAAGFLFVSILIG